MEKRIINPWTWQNERGYVQAVEVKQANGTLYCAGQAAVLPDGTSSSADMQTQLHIALQNLEQVIHLAGYACSGIVRLTVYTTSSETFVNTCFEAYKEWAAKHGVQTAVTLMEVNALFETLNIEFEATVVM
ncbi:RidA family protein [Chitinophaga varians]|uniref:RidA family protein n=1 Tax=Chitinophaga varians TaxID=2202339 RepID=UPI00165FB6D2|nr:RidA family protein [Chitinophaga varians]MBC9914975.1 RidA family protein [Chitinophaga varians]